MLPAAPPPARTNARTCMVFDHHLLPQPCGVGQAGSHAGRHALQGQGDLAQQGEGAGGRVYGQGDLVQQQGEWAGGRGSGRGGGFRDAWGDMMWYIRGGCR